MPDYTRQVVGRASAVLTTAEVAGAALNLGQVKDKILSVDTSFTIGSLTNVILTFYASFDGTNYDVITNGVTAMAETLTASAERCYVVGPLTGYKWFRVSATGTGTVTNSLCAITYRFERRGSL